jgi:hypothetical protein
MSNFNFKLKKRDKRIFLSFPVSQISTYSPGAQLDFFSCFKKQLEELNGEILVEWNLQEDLYKVLDKYNELNLAPKTLEKLYLKRSLIQFFSHSINCHLIEDWKTALELFKKVYE